MTQNTVNETERMVVTRVFDAPRELVWKAWTDPKYVMQWWGPKGFTAPVCQMDFRVGGRIFATLGYPSAGWGVVKLTPDQQELFVQVAPEVFVPVKGAWGRRGATSVRLRAAPKGMVRNALVAAWCNTAPKALGRQFKSLSSSSPESDT